MNSSLSRAQLSGSLRGKLQYLAADGSLQTIWLERTVFSIGRKSLNDLHLSDTRVSRFHAEIIREQQHYILRDKGSRCGTYVNGEPITQKLLENGDRIRFGDAHAADYIFFDAATDSLPTQPFQTQLVAEGQTANPALRRLELVLETIRAVHAVRSLEEILRLIVDVTVELTGTERGFIMLKGTSGELEQRIARKRGRAELTDDLSISHRLAQKVFTTGEPIIVSDTEGDLSLGTRDSIAALGLRAIACYPLTLAAHHEGEPRSGDLHGEIIGVLYVDGRASSAQCAPEAREALSSLVNQAAMVIENARLQRVLQEKRAFEKELALAYQIQQQLLPRELPEREYLEVASINVPCRDVGGDYYDYMLFEDGRTGIVIGDVSGKGIPAALMMSTLQGIFYAQAFSCAEVAHTVAHVNRYLVKRSMENNYLTAFYGVIAPDGTLIYTNAGHNPPILARCDGRIERLSEGGLALGMFEQAQYQAATTRLEEGDVLLLFSDGVTDATNEDDQDFGDQQLIDLITRLRAASAREILDRALEEIRSYSHRARQHDDLTLMTVKYVRDRETLPF
jgi:sigma-B regulation protein RsbU (phosphoserine phosphatase)